MRPPEPRRRPRVATGHEIPDTLAFAISADELSSFENEVMAALDDGWETRPEFPWRVTTIPKELAKGTPRTTHFYHILLFKITDWSTRQARERAGTDTGEANDLVRQMQKLAEHGHHGEQPAQPAIAAATEERPKQQQAVTIVARETYVTTLPPGEVLSPEAMQRLQQHEKANEDKTPK